MLALGAAAGIALAVASVLAPPEPLDPGVSGDVVATVNGRPIRRAALERAVAGLATDLDRAVTAAEKARVLERLIEEELLVQRGLSMNLPGVDPHVRSNLVGVVIETIVANAESADATPEALRAFYENNLDYFARPGRLSLRQIFVSAYGDEDAARRRAETAVLRLEAGEPFPLVARELGDEEIAPLPAGLISIETAREVLGPTALASALRLEPGERSAVVRSGTGFHVMEMLDRRAPETPPLEKIKDAVEGEYRRRQGEGALRDTLDDLRAGAEVRVARDAD
jgi:parvulin-like peptidyl-prolyl isomerase